MALWRYHIACGPVGLSSTPCGPRRTDYGLVEVSYCVWTRRPWLNPLWTTLPEETGLDAVNGLSCRCLIFYKNLTKKNGVCTVMHGCAKGEGGGGTRVLIWWANLGLSCGRVVR